ncbi:MAG: pre-mRNA-splicing factor CWC25 family protein [archaeon]|nr:pre-mRNA-splicing factor CWC25 family protein [archaeon]
MGLSFLNKKIWHPGSFANIEKVWIAEQKHKELERKAIENAKKVKEEKAIEDLKKLQAENGLIPKSHLNRLDFMYQGPDSKNKLISAEEFLLGKSIEDEDNANKRHFTPVFQESYSNPQNEIFTKIHEDPLYLIKKEEMRQRKEIEENPYKVKMLLKDLESKENKLKKKNKETELKKELTEKIGEKKEIKEEFKKPIKIENKKRKEESRSREKERSRSRDRSRSHHRHHSKYEDRHSHHHGHREHHHHSHRD